MGWCTTQLTDNNTENPTCNGQTYTAGQDYPLGEIDTDTTVYAIWKSTLPQRKYSITYEQGYGYGECIKGKMRTDITTMPSPNPQTGTTTATSVQLSPTTPIDPATRYADTFQKWCSVMPDNFSSGCPRTTYTTGQSIPLPELDNNITLWAMWSYSSGGSALDCQAGGGLI